MDAMSGNERRDAAISEAKASTRSEPPVDGHQDKPYRKSMDDNFRRRAEILMRGIKELPKNWDDLTPREQRDFVTRNIESNWKNVPRSLVPICTGSAIMEESEAAEQAAPPAWLDREKCLRGQRFAMDNFAGIFFAELLSLYALFSFDNGLKPLIITGKSSEPLTSSKRYLSTCRRVRNWFTSDVWSKDTAGYKDVRAVRKLHSSIRQRLMDSSQDEIDEASRIKDPWSPTRDRVLQDVRDCCPASKPRQCPFMLGDEDKLDKPKGLNQGEMASTQFGFIGLAILYPERFGIHGATDEDLEAFCHLWRSLGYLLGIEDEFNFCSGSLEEVKQRSRDFLEYWVKPNLRDVTPEWEHMLRCVMEGISFYAPATSYEHGLLYVAEMLEIPMPRVRESLGYISRIRYELMKVTFNRLAKLPGVRALMNRRLNRLVDRAPDLIEKKHQVFKEKSDKALSKGIAETIATRNGNEIYISTQWFKTPFLVFLSTCFLLKFPNIVNEFAKKMFHIDVAATLNR